MCLIHHITHIIIHLKKYFNKKKKNPKGANSRAAMYNVKLIDEQYLNNIIHIPMLQHVV